MSLDSLKIFSKLTLAKWLYNRQTFQMMNVSHRLKLLQALKFKSVDLIFFDFNTFRNLLLRVVTHECFNK